MTKNSKAILELEMAAHDSDFLLGKLMTSFGTAPRVCRTFSEPSPTWDVLLKSITNLTISYS